MKKFFSLLLIATLLLLSGCNSAVSSSDKLNIVCTLFPQYDFTRQITDSLAEVTLLLPAGTESHSFEPTPSDIIKISSCDIFIYIGDEMETWAKSVMSDIDETKTTVINVTDKLELSVSSHSHGSDSVDPHIWTSVMNAIDTVELIRDVLMEKDPANSKAYAENAGILLSEYANLDLRIRNTVKNAARNEIVFAGRFALHNFTSEYGIDCIAAFDSCSEESEPSAARIAEIIDYVNGNNVPIIFYEELKEPKTANAIAAETNASARLFHSCHNLSAEEFARGETYLSLMEQNLNYLSEALS